MKPLSAAEVRIRAERRCGQLLAEMEKGKGGQPKKNSSQRKKSSFAQAKEAANISDGQAARWQKLAEMDHVDFENKLDVLVPFTSRIESQPRSNHPPGQC